MRRVAFVWLLLSPVAGAAMIPAHPTRSGSSQLTAEQEQRVGEQLTIIRKKVLLLEQQLVAGTHAASKARANIRKIHELLILQHRERALGLKREAQLEDTVRELESRKAVLDTQIIQQRSLIRRSLAAIERSLQFDTIDTPEHEKWEAPRRHVLAALVNRGITQAEELRIDIEDANQLEQSINGESQQLTYMFHELDEQKNVLELNRRIQADIIRKKGQERLAQLAHYQKLKAAEGHVEDLVQSFDARVELEKQTQTESLASKAALEHQLMYASAFAREKGRLQLPLAGGKILTRFGRAFDPRSGLYVFKKGIEIEGAKNQPVQAIYAGKVAFSGELPDYGRVTIIDHGNHFYSICAHLGSLLKKAGDKVTAGESIGETDDSGTPVYFEIRARNVAVNPLQWVSN